MPYKALKDFREQYGALPKKARGMISEEFLGADPGKDDRKMRNTDGYLDPGAFVHWCMEHVEEPDDDLAAKLAELANQVSECNKRVSANRAAAFERGELEYADEDCSAVASS